VKTAGRINGALDSFFAPMSKAAAVVGKVTTEAGQLTRRAAAPSLLGAFGKAASSPEMAFDKRRDELMAASQNMHEGVRNVVTEKFGEIAAHDPHGFGGAVMTASTALDFLMGKMPQSGPNLQSLTPMTSRIQPSKAEIAQFSRYWNAVNSPTSVIDHFADGTISSDEVEVLQVVYPRMYQQIQTETQTRVRAMDEAGEELPIRARMMLDTLLDLNGLGEPAFAPTFGATYGAQMGAPPPQKGTPPHSGGPANLSKNLSTRTSAMIGG
jgi:hypothetical protein